MRLGEFPTDVADQILQHVEQSVLRDVWLQMDDLNPLRQLVAAHMVIEVPSYYFKLRSDFDDFVQFAQQESKTRIGKLKLQTTLLDEKDFAQFVQVCTEYSEFIGLFHTIEFEGTSDRYRRLASVLPKENIVNLNLKVSSFVEPELLPRNLETVALVFLENHSFDLQLEVKRINPFESVVSMFLHFNVLCPVNLVDFNWPARLKRLSVNNADIPSLSNVAFPDSLESLQLRVRLLTLEGAVFPPFLKELDLSLNNLKLLVGTMFPDLLRMLNLSFNSIELIGNVEFPTGLLDISLKANKILDLDQVVFPSLLCRLDLISNEIETLDGAKLPAPLKTLALSGNPIKRPDLWKFPSQLEVLALYKCSLERIENVKLPNGLLSLDIGLNNILDLTQVVFPDLLQQLDLGSNEIETLIGAKFPSQLKRLDLSNNCIETVHDETLPKLLEELVLSDNYIEEFAGTDLPNLKLIDLSYNESDDETEEENQGCLQRLSNCKFPASLEHLLVANQPVEDWLQVALPPQLKTLTLMLLENPVLLKLPPSLEILKLVFPEDSDFRYSDLKLPRGLQELYLENGVSSEFDWGLPSLVRFTAWNFTGPISTPDSEEEPLVCERRTRKV